MKYDIQYGPSYALGIISLDAGEKIQAETGAMVSMSDTIKMETGMKGGLLGGLKRSVLGGESFFLNTFEAEQPGEVTIAPALPGDILALELAGLPLPDDLQGRSLLPILTGRAPPEEHREFVRCEYMDAVDLPDHSYATMYRNRRWKLVVYHGHGLGELYDLQNDPYEFESLWDSADHQQLKLELMQKSFDATVLATDAGPPRVMPY